MKVVHICTQDWANFQYQISEALRSVGVDSNSYTLEGHPFSYPYQSEVVSKNSLRELTNNVDFVILHHSSIELLRYIKTDRLIVYHAGSKYRQQYKTINDLLNPIVKASFIALPELYTLGAKNPNYIVGAVDTDKIVSKYIPDGIKVAHYPSNPVVKGTEKINKIVNELQKKHDFIYNHSTKILPYEDHLKRLDDCDIYIELFADMQGDKPYGSFGMTALEAASLSKIVITQNISGEKLYEQTYGNCELNICNTEKDLKITLENILRYYEYGAREWVVNNHSYQATGQRIKSILERL